ncbi:MAG: hypothetical protein APU95_02970 [Hadesarchaea archaeon YNP_N21]|nr:MAG: hypothetical protein APU95_02970 [Hadesarchaea archaeon YNP_N21]
MGDGGNSPEIRFERNIIIRGKIVCRTGLRIGGLQEEIKIGGVENIIIRDPITDKPYIPGSSIKGKLRSLLELNEKAYSQDGLPHSHSTECGKENCKICRIFGSSSEDVKRGPTRLIVRDSFLESELEEVEVKAENVINRLTGKAEHPRFMERVPAGTEFGLEMVYGVYLKEDIDDLKTVFELMGQLQDSYLGGSGSRGYGKVEFKDISITVKRREDYVEGRQAEPLDVDGKNKFTVPELITEFEKIREKMGN